jgi:aspartate kinase
MIVQKYGGSSVETIDKMRAIAQKIASRKLAGEDVVVVVSAMGKTTNMLIEMANSAVANPSKREVDMLISTGEQVSTALLAMILNDLGIQAVSLTGFQAGIQTEGLHTKNKIKDINIQKINQHIAEGKVVVIAGFQGVNITGDITTLGRGGSDTTAVALAAKLLCHCEIYTDVDGIYGVNPKLYPQAKKLNEISYEEMSELAFLGAKVMEPRAVEIGQQHGVEIYVASAHEDLPGTTIKEIHTMLEQRNITGLSVIDNIVMITINHFPHTSKSVSDLFTRIAENEINIDMISQTILSDGLLNISFTFDASEMKSVEAVLKELQVIYPFFNVNANQRISKLSVVGIGMRSQSGVAARLFKLFADHDILFQLVTTSEISISYTIPNDMVEKSVKVISEAFGL